MSFFPIFPMQHTLGGDTAAYRFVAGTTDAAAFWGTGWIGGTTWTRDSGGDWSEKSASTPPIHYHPDDDVPYLYVQTQPRTNRALHCRDFTQATFAAAGITAARDATGIDGAANSASTLTAGAAGGTIFQDITNAATAWRISCFVRRKTGTGPISVSPDGGTTKTDIAGLIDSSAWTRFEITHNATNPTVGFEIVTGGDAIEVDFLQVEDVLAVGDAASLPILTTTDPVTRVADTAPSKTVSSHAGAASIKWDGRLAYSNGYSYPATLHGAGSYDNAAAIAYTSTAHIFGQSRSGGGTQFNEPSGFAYTLGARRKVCLTLDTNDGDSFVNGVLDRSNGAISNPGAMTVLQLVNRGDGEREVIQYTHEVAIWKSKISNTPAQSESSLGGGKVTPTVTLVDSWADQDTGILWSQSITVPSGQDVLFVGVGGTMSSAGSLPSGVTYAGQAMTPIYNEYATRPNWGAWASLWRLNNPPTSGTLSVAFPSDPSNNQGIIAASVSGLKQQTDEDKAFSELAWPAEIATTVTPLTNDAFGIALIAARTASNLINWNYGETEIADVLTLGTSRPFAMAYKTGLAASAQTFGGMSNAAAEDIIGIAALFEAEDA